MEMYIVISNIMYAFIGIVLTIIGMVIGYKIFDLITPFDTGKALAEGNTAIGMVVGYMILSMGIAVGLVVGLGLN